MITSWLMDELLAADSRRVKNVPAVQLPDNWVQFETELGKYKSEYVKTLAKHKLQEVEVNKLTNDINVMMTCMTSVQSKEILDELKKLVEEFKQKNNYNEKKEESLHTAGKIKSMQNVLLNTNASRYDQFTCSVCMDRLVDTFLDPCGHVMCRTCHVRSMNSQCPFCRTTIIEPKKIYTTM
jgi:Zinc finger, C3HC4 type (RING finger)